MAIKLLVLRRNWFTARQPKVNFGGTGHFKLALCNSVPIRIQNPVCRKYYMLPYKTCPTLGIFIEVKTICIFTKSTIAINRIYPCVVIAHKTYLQIVVVSSRRLPISPLHLRFSEELPRSLYCFTPRLNRRSSLFSSITHNGVVALSQYVIYPLSVPHPHQHVHGCLARNRRNSSFSFIIAHTNW